MADWQEWISSCFISLLFAYMLAKLFSIIVAFQKDKLRVERGNLDSSDGNENSEAETAGSSRVMCAENRDVKQQMEMCAPAKDQYSVGEKVAIPSEAFTRESIDQTLEEASTDVDNVVGMSSAFSSSKNGENVEEEADKENMEEESLLSDEEEWEGIDGSDLDKLFSKAASCLETLVLNPACKMSNDTKLQFYGLYKQATEGPCSTSQPPAYRLSARAKWNSWKSLGDISPEEGMQRYIALLSELSPDWNQATKERELAGSSDLPTGSNTKSSRMGPVFSTLLSDIIDQEGLEDLHKCAKDGDIKGLESLLESNTAVDYKDSDGRTALHWAADQGHLDIVKLLLSRGAQINAKDLEGQTPLHYASTCEWDEIAAFLLENGADPSLVDNDGCTPYGHSFSPGEKPSDIK